MNWSGSGPGRYKARSYHIPVMKLYNLHITMKRLSCIIVCNLCLIQQFNIQVATLFFLGIRGQVMAFLFPEFLDKSHNLHPLLHPPDHGLQLEGMTDGIVNKYVISFYSEIFNKVIPELVSNWVESVEHGTYTVGRSNSHTLEKGGWNTFT